MLYYMPDQGRHQYLLSILLLKLDKRERRDLSHSALHWGKSLSDVTVAPQFHRHLLRLVIRYSTRNRSHAVACIIDYCYSGKTDFAAHHDCSVPLRPCNSFLLQHHSRWRIGVLKGVYPASLRNERVEINQWILTAAEVTNNDTLVSVRNDLERE